MKFLLETIIFTLATARVHFKTPEEEARIDQRPNTGAAGAGIFTIYGPINLLSDRLLRYVLIFEYQILVLDLVVDIRTKMSEGI